MLGITFPGDGAGQDFLSRTTIGASIMKKRDIGHRRKSTAGKLMDKTASNERHTSRATETFSLTEDDRDRFLQIIEETARIK
ncbi:MAG: hypothetical protein ABI547_07680, partial [Betaproteobacteria bacterium]